MEHLPGIESALAEAAEKAGKYEWMKAAEVYRPVVDKLDPAVDAARAADLSELLAKSYFRATFQSNTRDEFRNLMSLSEQSQQKAAAMHEEAGSEPLAKRPRPGPYSQLTGSKKSPNEKRTLLEKAALSTLCCDGTREESSGRIAGLAIGRPLSQSRLIL